MKISITRFKQLEEIEIDVQAVQFGVAIAQATLLINTGWSGNKLATSLGQNQLIYLPIKDVAYLAKNGELKTDKNRLLSKTGKSDNYS